MNKSSRLVLLVSLLFVGFNSCQRDDLCDSSQAVTPRLIITFVDAGNTLERKAVPTLSITDLASSNLAPLNDSGSTSLAAVDSIAIPLDSNTDLTRYRFTQNDGTSDFIDDIEFSYIVNEEYINRACGFKNTYDELNTAITSVTPSWIDNIEVLTDNVTNTNTIHVEVRH